MHIFVLITKRQPFKFIEHFCWFDVSTPVWTPVWTPVSTPDDKGFEVG